MNRFLKIIPVLIVIFLLARSLLLVYPDLNLAYPFLAPDSYDWIANGLYYEGYDVNYSFRAPALPLIIAALDKLGMLRLMPVVNQMVLLALLLTFHSLCVRRFSQLTSLLLILILFFNFFLQNLSLYILADIYAMLFILLGSSFYADAEDNERRYIHASLFLSLSFLFQYAALFVMPALLLHWCLRRRQIALRTAAMTFLPPLILIGGWLIYKKVTFGSFLRSGVQQVELIRPHLTSIFFYLFNILSVLSIPVAVLVFWGIALSVFTRERKNHDFLLQNLLLVAAWFIFWAMCYTWNDRRFVLYLMFFLIPFAGVAIQSLISRAATHASAGIILAVLGLAAIAGSAIPYECAFTLDRIQVTNNTAIRCGVIVDDMTSNATIDPASIHLVRGGTGFSPLNLRRLRAMRSGVNVNELGALARLRSELAGRSATDLCVSYDTFDKFRWYIDKNRYGNYFRKRLMRYPECPAPNLRIIGGSLELYPSGPRVPAASGRSL